MKKLVVWFAAVVVLGVASPALANQIQVGYGTTGMARYGPYQTGIGGEFTLNDVNPNSWLDLSGYSTDPLTQTANFGPSGITSFQSFCIEKTEYLYPYSATYNATLTDGSINGGVSGGNPDPLSLGTAYLYSQFAQGALTGYNYTGDRASSAAALQQAIWWLEGELGAAAPAPSNVFLTLLTTSGGFSDLTAAKANANGAYGVQVLNLTGVSGAPAGVAQDQLYFNKQLAGPAAPVPDGGSTLALLGTALLLAALGLRRLGPGAPKA